MERKKVKQLIMAFSAVLMMIAFVVIQRPLMSEAKSASDYPLYWTNVNTYSVSSGPVKATKFKVPSGKKLKLNAISLYHYNYGAGKTPGKITLKKGSTKIGTWSATGSYGNTWWDVFPNKTLSAGTYTITCSSKSTWCYNSSSNSAGFAYVYGKYVSNSSVGKPTIKSINYYGKNPDNSKYIGYKITVGKVSKASGYLFQISTKKDFSNVLLKVDGKGNILYHWRKSSASDNARFYVRVRAYKKSGSKKIYGKWSATKSYVFSFKKKSVPATKNLLVNGTAEKGSLKGWKATTDKWNVVDANKYSEPCKPYKGKYFFYAEYENEPISTLYQTVSIDSKYIGKKAYVTAYTCNWDQTPRDQSKIKISFIDKNGKTISSATKTSSTIKWKKVAFNKTIPSGTKKIKISLIAVNKCGVTDAYFDNVSLILK